jgi:hypothetical protein
VFGRSDGYVGGDGWYIDDVQIAGVVPNCDEIVPEIACIGFVR